MQALRNGISHEGSSTVSATTETRAIGHSVEFLSKAGEEESSQQGGSFRGRDPCTCAHSQPGGIFISVHDGDYS